MKIFLLAFVMAPFLVDAQSETVKKKYNLTDLEFMAGNWKTTTEWGDMDEFWSKPMGNSIMCTYRCVKNGKIVFYEFVTIEQQANDSVPIMRLRHFYPGSVAWEDKNGSYAYPLVSLAGQTALFERPDKKSALSYERTGKDTMKTVLIQDKDGKKTNTDFFFKSF